MDDELSTNSKPVADDGTVGTDKVAADKATFKFLADKKRTIKKSQYRERFDALAAEIDLNIINTTISYGQKLYEKSGWGSMVFYNKMANGAYDINVYPQKLTDRDQNRSGVPVSQEPIALSKILIATSVLFGKQPDAEVVADDKVYAKAIHDLWKRNWSMKGGNGQNTLQLVSQNLFTYGWAAWRVYPKRISVKRKGVDKLLFDDVYREPMDPKRTWLGLGFTNGDYWSQFEVLYEKDMLKSEFFHLYPQAKDYKKSQLDYCTTSDDAKDEDQVKAEKSVTISYYENVLLNRYIVACGKLIIYDGEMPNDDSFGSVVVARCFVKNILDPYGVGLYEMMRGNTAMFTYINSLNAQQVEAETARIMRGDAIPRDHAVVPHDPTRQIVAGERLDTFHNHRYNGAEKRAIERAIERIEETGADGVEQANRKMEMVSAMWAVRGGIIDGLPDEAASWIDHAAALTQTPLAYMVLGFPSQAIARYECARHCWSLLLAARAAEKGVRL